jgi:Protein of unknown function (DUF1176)
MSLRFVSAALAGTMLAASIYAAPVELGRQVFHQDWAAACDNILACEAVSLLAEDEADRLPTMVVSRANDASDAVSAKISLVEPRGDRYRLLVDGRLVDSGVLAKGEFPIQIQGAEALKVVRAAARGRKLTIMASDGSTLGELGLAGSAAALAHIDAVQGRAGTRSALFTVGRKAFRPKTIALPIVQAARIGKQEDVPAISELVKLIEASQCADARNSVTEDAAYSLGKRDGIYRSLVMISCGTGAYNMSAAPYIGTSKNGKKWEFQPARFDYSVGDNDEPRGVNLLVNYSWDAEKQQLSSYSKGRGLGDCGNAETYVWDGGMFRLVQAHAMEECRGSTEWMTLWRAKVEFITPKN